MDSLADLLAKNSAVPRDWVQQSQNAALSNEFQVGLKDPEGTWDGLAKMRNSIVEQIADRALFVQNTESRVEQLREQLRKEEGRFDALSEAIRIGNTSLKGERLECERRCGEIDIIVRS